MAASQSSEHQHVERIIDVVEEASAESFPASDPPGWIAGDADVAKPIVHIRGVVLDVDGTLIDSNDAHAHAWVDALTEFGYQVSFEDIRRLIGMGADKLLPSAIHVEKDSDKGKQITARRMQIFNERYLPTIKPFADSKELLEKMRASGLKLAIATSAQPDEMNALLQVTGLIDLVEKKTSSADSKNSKPDPDIVQAAIRKLGFPTENLVMLGDTPYDVQAALKVNIPIIALRSGGWDDASLIGATLVYENPSDLLRHYTETILA